MFETVTTNTEWVVLMKDDRQPWLEGNPEEYCWCDGCIRERDEEMTNA